ncbi:MAG: hypothetical protein GWO04_31450, partial [Actinobacteria bacterium]|nr:hypothetical protein [Actinomycetota bacterium]
KGTFRLSPIDPEQNYTVRVRAEGYAPGERAVNDLEPYRVKSGVRVELDRGRRLTGRVVDVEEHPVADVKVSLAP